MEPDRPWRSARPGRRPRPGVEVPRHQPGDDLRLDGGSRWSRSSGAPDRDVAAGALVAVVRRGRPKRGHVFPGSSRPLLSLLVRLGVRCSVKTTPLHDTPGPKGRPRRRWRRRCPAPRGLLTRRPRMRSVRDWRTKKSVCAMCGGNSVWMASGRGGEPPPRASSPQVFRVQVFGWVCPHSPASTAHGRESRNFAGTMASPDVCAVVACARQEMSAAAMDTAARTQKTCRVAAELVR